MMPKRIQRKRTKGWKKPDNTINVCRPSKYGNPFKISDDLNREQCIILYEEWLLKTFSVEELKSELKGKNLMCFCNENLSCHADVLLRIANEK